MRGTGWRISSMEMGSRLGEDPGKHSVLMLASFLKERSMAKVALSGKMVLNTKVNL